MFTFLEEKEYPYVYSMLIDYQFYSKAKAKSLLLESPFKLIKKDDEKIVGYLFSKNIALHIKQFFIQANCIDTLGVHVDYRNRGYSHELFETYDYYAKKTSLFNICNTYSTKLLNKEGYCKIYDLITYSIPKFALQKIGYRNVYESSDVKDMLDVYQNFTKSFENYRVRDLTYFERLIEHVRLENQKIISFYHNNECKGYAIYSQNKGGVCKVKEIIYLNTNALKSLLAFVSEGCFDVMVTVSMYEPLNKLFKEASFKKNRALMLRVNHLTLFNKLFNKKVKLQNEVVSFFEGKNYFHDYFDE